MLRPMKSPHFQLVVVDLLSTVTGSAGVCARLLSSALDGEGIEVSPEDVRNVLGLPVRRAVSALARTGAGLDAQAQRHDRAHDAFVAGLRRHYSALGSVREVEGTAACFGRLRAQGLRLAIVTNLPRAVASTILESLDWYDRGLIDTVVTCEEVEEPRPQPGMVFEAMRRTAVAEARRVVKVGQTPADLAEGTLAGCGAVVGLTHGAHGRDELLLRPHTHLVDRLFALVDVIALSEVAPRTATAAARQTSAHNGAERAPHPGLDRR